MITGRTCQHTARMIYSLIFLLPGFLIIPRHRRGKVSFQASHLLALRHCDLSPFCLMLLPFTTNSVFGLDLPVPFTDPNCYFWSALLTPPVLLATCDAGERSTHLAGHSVRGPKCKRPRSAPGDQNPPSFLQGEAHKFTPQCGHCSCSCRRRKAHIRLRHTCVQRQDRHSHQFTPMV